MDSIKVSADGGSVFAGRGVLVFQAITIAKALEMYSKTKMIPNRLYTPTKMMSFAKEVTGAKLKSRDYVGGAAALMDWARKERLATEGL